MYTFDDVLSYVEEEDVKFIRLAYFDIWGKQKNVSVPPSELRRAMEEGISFDASAVSGFGDEKQSDLFLRPDPSTLSVLPWRPSHGRVVKMYCDVYRPDGSHFEKDSRYILKKAVADAALEGITVSVGPEMEFYLFKGDSQTEGAEREPLDRAGYMDIAPDDRGENIRREICLTLNEMGIVTEASHHEVGPGQNEIDFRYSDALSAADNTSAFKWAVKSVAVENGLTADFSPKPLENEAGSGMHINISVESRGGADPSDSFMAGVMNRIKDMTLFLNPTEDSYKRLGEKKAPLYISWSPENRSQLIRIPAASEGRRRIELRSPDPMCNPYIAYALIIRAGLEGIKNKEKPSAPVNENLYTADSLVTGSLEKLPSSLSEALEAAKNSRFVRECLPKAYLEAFEI